jgi:hypothetical protein
VTPAEVLALMEEVDLIWPGQGPAAAHDDEKVARLWMDWIGRYDWQTARQALRAFGGMQARPPSLAQILGECQKLAGDTLPNPSAVLHEFERMLAAGYSTHTLDVPWSHPLMARCAEEGLWAAYGQSADPAYDEYAPANANNDRRRMEGDIANVAMHYRRELREPPKPAIEEAR